MNFFASILQSFSQKGQKVTVDKKLEIKNVELVGKILAEIPVKLINDGHPVVAEFIYEEPPIVIIVKSQEWKAKHVCKSQYLLEIVKYTDENCCSPRESSYLKVINPSRPYPGRREKIKPFDGSVGWQNFLFLFIYLFIYLFLTGEKKLTLNSSVGL